MKVIREHAEESFLRHLEGMREKPMAGRCLYFPLAPHIKEDPGQRFSLMRLVSQHFEENEARLYLCEDGDIFLITGYFPLKRFESLRDALAYAVQTRDAATIGMMYEKERWDAVQKIAQEKQARAETVQEKKKPDRKTALNLAGTVDKELAQRLLERREKREETYVLLVEDDAFIRRLVGNVMPKGCRLVTAATGAEAVKHYLGEAPDIVFLDIALPDMSGHRVLEAIRERDAEAFVVMLSGNNDEQNVRGALKRGAKGYIAKPFTREKLHQYLQKCPTHRG